MNELKGRQGFKQESLIHFHRASLHMAFPFGKPQALSTNLRDYLTSSGWSQGPPLFSNLQRWNDTAVVCDYYYSWMILRMLLRSCLHVYVCGWRVGGVGGGWEWVSEASVVVFCLSIRWSFLRWWMNAPGVPLYSTKGASFMLISTTLLFKAWGLCKYGVTSLSSTNILWTLDEWASD